MKTNNRAKLTAKEVKAIRKLYENEGKKPTEIHKLYPQVCLSSIYKIVQYASWPMV